MKNSFYKSSWILSLTLFSMFFGAGNLIFAPYLGAQSGTSTLFSLTGFLITGVVLPISAVMIVSRYKGGMEMISRISRPLAILFMTLLYLLIGPCIAIPRTAGTSFEMFTWLLGDSAGVRIAYTLFFFAAATAGALYPGKLKDLLGRITAPLLLVLILAVCIGSLIIPSEGAALATEIYSGSPFATGFVEGYQTMDILAGICFGQIFMLNISQVMKQKNESGSAMVSKYMMTSAIGAGILLACIYTLLALCGMDHSSQLQSFSNGAQVISFLAYQVFGQAGQWITALIFLGACFNVCTGLLCCCSEYFHELVPKVSYTWWLFTFAVAGALTACLGLDSILALSAPLLSFITPVAILLLGYGAISWNLHKNKIHIFKHDA